jgi:hypothetical protein
MYPQSQPLNFLAFEFLRALCGLSFATFAFKAFDLALISP